MSTREKNLDLLRVIACIMVIALHVGAIYGKEINLEYPSYYFTIGNFYHSVTRTAVPIFIMLSGSFLLGNIRNIDYKYHYKKTFDKIIIPTLIWSILYVIYSICMGVVSSIINSEHFSYLTPIKNWILGDPFYHMWYMYMIIGCYAITPILIKVRLNIGNKTFETIGWICMFFGVVIDIIQVKLIWPISFIKYLGYFILGYSLKDKNDMRSKSYLRYLIGSGILLILIFLITEINIRYNIFENKFYFLQPLSPIVIVSSIWMYISFLNMKNIKIKIYKLSRHTFNIYLLHGGILYLIDLPIRKFLIEYPNPIWYMPILTMLVFYISYIASIFLCYINKVLEDNTKKNKVLTDNL